MYHIWVYIYVYERFVFIAKSCKMSWWLMLYALCIELMTCLCVCPWTKQPPRGQSFSEHALLADFRILFLPISLSVIESLSTFLKLSLFNVLSVQKNTKCAKVLSLPSRSHAQLHKLPYPLPTAFTRILKPEAAINIAAMVGFLCIVHMATPHRLHSIDTNIPIMYNKLKFNIVIRHLIHYYISTLLPLQKTLFYSIFVAFDSKKIRRKNENSRGDESRCQCSSVAVDLLYFPLDYGRSAHFFAHIFHLFVFLFRRNAQFECLFIFNLSERKIDKRVD